MRTFAHFDRFDIVEAWFVFLSEYHEGQGSVKYAKLCHLTSYFKPSPSVTCGDLTTEKAQAIYQNLVDQEEGN